MNSEKKEQNTHQIEPIVDLLPGGAADAVGVVIRVGPVGHLVDGFLNFQLIAGLQLPQNPIGHLAVVVVSSSRFSFRARRRTQLNRTFYLCGFDNPGEPVFIPSAEGVF